MQNIKEQITQLANNKLKDFIDIRRQIHQNPELSGEEYQTAGLVEHYLKSYGITQMKRLAKTGVVAYIEGKNPDKCMIALRADMDALPIIEQNQVDFISKNKGVMHACGHDAHTACLLGAAYILQQIKLEFEGTIMLIFQPSEEKFPGGAKMMLDEGLFKERKPEIVLGQHVLPEMNSGNAGFRPGKYMASTDEIYLTVKGKGGHGATPELNTDPIVIASHIIVALQQIVSRNAPSAIPTVLSFGRFIAEGRTNIIPDFVKIDGTLRTFDETWRAEAHQKITRMAQGIAEGMGGSCEVRIDAGYPFLVNDDMATSQAQSYAQEFMGVEHVENIDLRMTAEDFAYYSQQVPSCFFRLGTKIMDKPVTNLHTSTFDIDEQAIAHGMGLMAWLAYRFLQK